MTMIRAPFTPEQVAVLNRYQTIGVMHPFTCRNNSAHVLIATRDGWRCPDSHCTYAQDWAHDFMANETFVDAALAQMQQLQQRKARD